MRTGSTLSSDPSPLPHADLACHVGVVTRLAQVALLATDLDRAAAFWTDLLGTEPTGRFEPPGLLFFDLAGTRLLLEGAAPPSMLYLEVADVRERLEQVRDRVEVVSEPHQIFRHEDDTLGPAATAEWQAFIKDSEGNLVGLVSFEPATRSTEPEVPDADRGPA
jgi:methylmalonyl-CoA/ethylmalonyl-CoA epimerase